MVNPMASISSSRERDTTGREPSNSVGSRTATHPSSSRVLLFYCRRDAKPTPSLPAPCVAVVNMKRTESARKAVCVCVREREREREQQQ